MRLLLAGIFVFSGLSLAVVILPYVFGDNPPGILVAAVLSPVVAILVLFAFMIGNSRRKRHYVSQQPEDLMRLERIGFLSSMRFRATRAFQVQEFEDEGPHYFIELVDGSVLYLSGQYLYNYEPAENEPRRFPCTHFVVRRHRTEGYVVDIECSGEVLEPEFIAPHLEEKDYLAQALLQDGELICNRTYDDLKAQRQSEWKASRFNDRNPECTELKFL
jgi:hypothetical protein